MRRSARAAAARALLAVGAIGLALLPAPVRPAPPRRPAPSGPPNVLLISVDALRMDRLNSYGYARRVTSPHMDALARDGVLVETDVTASPWTTPSHLSLFTSLLPHRHGVVSSFSDIERGLSGNGTFPRLADERLTLAEALRAHGYRTAAFTGGATMDPRLGFGQGFERYETDMVKLSPKRMQPMLDWLGQPGAQPFFLFWHSFEVHAPYVSGDFLQDVMAPEPARRLRRALARLGRSTLDMKLNDSTLRGAAILREHDAYSREVCEALYDGGVLSMDRWLGGLIAFLRARGLYERTLIVLTSDHGEQLGERGAGFYNLHGRTLYEEMVRVPLIIKLPGQAHAGLHLRGVHSSLDVMPTILDLVAATPAQHEMQGRSLRSAIEGRGAAAGAASEEVALSEALSKGLEKKSIRTARDKLVVTVGPLQTSRHGRGYLPPFSLRSELYDLLRDPKELRSAIAGPSPDPAALARARSLEILLRALHVGQTGRTGATTLDPATRERLKALGYSD